MMEKMEFYLKSNVEDELFKSFKKFSIMEQKEIYHNKIRLKKKTLKNIRFFTII